MNGRVVCGGGVLVLVWMMCSLPPAWASDPAVVQAESGVRRAGGRIFREQRRAVAVDFSKSLRFADGLAHLPILPGLRKVNLSGCAVTVPHLAVLADCEALQELDLSRCPLTERHVAALTHCTALRQLDLARTGIDDASLARLMGLDNLTRLDVSYTNGTDAGMAALASFERLEELNLSGLRLTRAGLATLRELPNLSRLALDDTPCRDDWLRELAPHEGLKSLSLCRTDITDGGLEHLHKLPKLDDLQVVGADTTFVGRRFYECERIDTPGRWNMMHAIGQLENQGGPPQRDVIVFEKRPYENVKPPEEARRPAFNGRHSDRRTLLNLTGFAVLWELQSRRGTTHYKNYHGALQVLENAPMPDRGIFTEFGSTAFSHLHLRHAVRVPGAQIQGTGLLPISVPGVWQPWPYSFGFRDGICTIRKHHALDEDGRPVPSRFDHVLKISSGGTRLNIDGKFDFDLTDGKKYIAVDAKGVAREVGIR